MSSIKSADQAEFGPPAPRNAATRCSRFSDRTGSPITSEHLTIMARRRQGRRWIICAAPAFFVQKSFFVQSPLEDLRHDGAQYTLRFAEKGGKAREIPVRHDLERLLLAYIDAAGITSGPLFRSAAGKTGLLTDRAMTAIDICRMMKRRLKDAGLATRYSPHSFRVTTITDLLEQDVPLEDVQYLAGHADSRTTRLYDRSHRKVTRNLVERISIELD